MPNAATNLALNALDYWVFVGFLVGLAVVGYVSGRGERESSEDYFLAGRNLPWYVVGGSFIAANISTEQFIGMVGATYILGVSTALWDWLNAFTFIFMIFLFVPFLLKSRVVTIPEFLEKRYSPTIRRIFAVITVIANIIIFMAAVLYAGGLALSGFLGWSLLSCIILTGVFAGSWAIYGGLSSVAWTGLFTAVIKIGGVATLSVFGLLAVAGNGNIIDGFMMVLERNRALTGPWHDALIHSVPHLTSAGAYDRLNVIQGPDHPMTPWTGLALLILSVSIWYNVLNQFIIQRILGAKNIWHGAHGYRVRRLPEADPAHRHGPARAHSLRAPPGIHAGRLDRCPAFGGRRLCHTREAASAGGHARTPARGTVQRRAGDGDFGREFHRYRRHF